jgi:hypothetical protein
MNPIDIHVTKSGKTVKVYPDECPVNPRKDYDHTGTITYAKGSRYVLGDEGVTVHEMEAIARRRDVIAFPVYAYIHSGIALSLSPFSCPWDSGQSGIIYATKEKIRKDYGIKRITKETVQKLRDVFAAELAEFQQFINGEVYAYTVEDKDGNVIDSCGGLYGFEYAITESRRAAG